MILILAEMESRYERYSCAMFLNADFEFAFLFYKYTTKITVNAITIVYDSDVYHALVYFCLIT